jgi:hypothetical protein
MAHFTFLHRRCANDDEFDALRVPGLSTTLDSVFFKKTLILLSRYGQHYAKRWYPIKTTLMFLKLHKKHRFSKLNLCVPQVKT